MSDKYAFIRSEEGNYDVRKMCRWANVSRGGYLDWRDREPSRTAIWRANLTEVVVNGNDKPIWPHCDALIWPHPARAGSAAVHGV